MIDRRITTSAQSPERRNKPANGTVIRYVEEVLLTYEGDECLTWPFSTNHQGYPQVRHAGRTRRVSRILCEAEHGAAPTAKHEAAHSCGNEGCVTRRHLRWATRAENEADKRQHGTAPVGASNGRAKLSESDICAIIGAIGDEPRRLTAERFNISVTHVAYIQNGKSWRHLSIGDQ